MKLKIGVLNTCRIDKDLVVRCMRLFQVMGNLAAEKPEHGKPLSGILIKRGFNYHLIGPDDLQSKSVTELFIRDDLLLSGMT